MSAAGPTGQAKSDGAWGGPSAGGRARVPCAQPTGCRPSCPLSVGAPLARGGERGRAGAVGDGVTAPIAVLASLQHGHVSPDRRALESDSWRASEHNSLLWTPETLDGYESGDVPNHKSYNLCSRCPGSFQLSSFQFVPSTSKLHFFHSISVELLLHTVEKWKITPVVFFSFENTAHPKERMLSCWLCAVWLIDALKGLQRKIVVI